MAKEQFALWIPDNLDSNSVTMDIAKKMTDEFGVSKIDNDKYSNDFNKFYEQHMFEQGERDTFCSKNGKGINIRYLIENAKKGTYITLLLLDFDKYQTDYFDVLAAIVFKWSATANSGKVQAFCSNQKMQNKGAGTKLLNMLKKVLLNMKLNTIYLNPVPEAVTYYSKQRFKPTTNVSRKIHDSSTPKSRSKSKSKTKSKTKSKSKSKSKNVKEIEPPTMSLNLRSERNWNALKSKMSSYTALTRKKYGKTFNNDRKNIIITRTNKILSELKGDDREFASANDIIRFLHDKHDDITDDDELIVLQYLRDELDMW